VGDLNRSAQPPRGAGPARDRIHDSGIVQGSWAVARSAVSCRTATVTTASEPGQRQRTLCAPRFHTRDLRHSVTIARPCRQSAWVDRDPPTKSCSRYFEEAQRSPGERDPRSVFNTGGLWGLWGWVASAGNGRRMASCASERRFGRADRVGCT
jgi:hypothetical protein